MAGTRNYIRLPEGKVEFKQRLTNIGIFASPAEMEVRNILGDQLGESRGDRWWAARMTVFSKKNCYEFFKWDGVGEKPADFTPQRDFNAQLFMEMFWTGQDNTEEQKPEQVKSTAERLPNGVPLIERGIFKGKKRISFLQEIEWVRQHYMLKGLSATEAPTPWCWSQVQEIQRDAVALRTFTEVFVAKLNPTKKEQEEAENKHGDGDGQEGYLKRLMSAFCEATGQKMPDLNTDHPHVDVLQEGTL